MNEIFSNPELATFIGYSWWTYENPYPILLSYADAVYQGRSFPDCGETTLRNFFNILLYNPKEQIFDIKKFSTVIQARKGKFSQELIDYYLKYDTTGSQTSQEARNDWAAVTSNLASVNYLKSALGFDENVCEMNSGITNIMNMILHLVHVPQFD